VGRPLDQKLIPAVVVVDAMNVKGLIREVIGIPRLPDVDGIRAAVKAFGFKASEVHIAVATESTGRRTSDVLKAVDENKGYADRVRRSGAGVLEGKLRDNTERGGPRKFEEKLVDVLCAVQVARTAHSIATGRSSAKAIIILSKDMDLSPATNFAEELGVPVFSAAPSVLDRRPEPFLLLGERELNLMAGRPQGVVGSSRRNAVAQTAWDPPTRLSSWTVLSPLRRDGTEMIQFCDANGIGGICPSVIFTSRPERNTSLSLAAQTADVGQRGRDYPLLRLASVVAGVRSGTVDEAQVLERTRPTQAQIEVRGVKVTIETPRDGVLVGDRVLVKNVQGAWKYVGVLNSAHSGATGTMLVTMTDRSQDGIQLGLLPDGQVCDVVFTATHMGLATSKVAVVLTGKTSATGRPQALAVSSYLPDAAKL
jgi:hypothetical protein